MTAQLFAPSSSVGVTQIVPTLGAHEQIIPTDEQLTRLVVSGQIVYEPDYGPNARVYRPVGYKDGNAVRKLLTDVSSDPTAKWLRRFTAAQH